MDNKWDMGYMIDTPSDTIRPMSYKKWQEMVKEEQERRKVLAHLHIANAIRRYKQNRGY